MTATRPMTPRRRLLAAAGLSLASLLLLELAWRLLGTNAVELFWPRMKESFGRRGTLPLARIVQRVEALATAAFALARGAWLLIVVVVVAIRVRPRFLTALRGAAAAWLLLELFVAPGLAPWLGLHHCVLARDPDHRPMAMAGEAGWNSDALVGTPESDAFKPEAMNLLFLGDSFTMGLLLPHPETEAFPSLVASELEAAFPDLTLNVANFGWVSASPLLELRRLTEIGGRYHPDLVVLCLDMTDPHDDIKYANLFERRGLAGFYDRLPVTIELLDRFAPVLFQRLYDATTGGSLPRHRFFHCTMPLEQSRPFLEPVAASIGRIEARSHELGAGFVVFVLPRHWQYGDRECPDDWELESLGGRDLVLGPFVREPFRYFEELGLAGGSPVCSLLEDFERCGVSPHCFRGDPHWNEAGHRVAAAAIARRLQPLVAARAAGKPGK